MDVSALCGKLKLYLVEQIFIHSLAQKLTQSILIRTDSRILRAEGGFKLWPSQQYSSWVFDRSERPAKYSEWSSYCMDIVYTRACNHSAWIEWIEWVNEWAKIANAWLHNATYKNATASPVVLTETKYETEKIRRIGVHAYDGAGKTI